MHDGEKVVEINPGLLVKVKTTTRSYQAKSLVITAGPWTNQLLRPLGIELPLQVRVVGSLRVGAQEKPWNLMESNLHPGSGQPWANSFTSLSLNFITCNIGG